MFSICPQDSSVKGGGISPKRHSKLGTPFPIIIVLSEVYLKGGRDEKGRGEICSCHSG